MDDGYFAHAVLAQLFAKSEEHVELPFDTFAIDDVMMESPHVAPDELYVLAYAPQSGSALEAQMGPARDTLLRGFKSTRMPSFERGQPVAFRARVCPTVRTQIAGEQPLRVGKNGKPQSRELDAFVHRALVEGPDVKLSREDVYRAWFEQSVKVCEGACTVDELRLTEFRREAMRRRAGDHGARIERPNALLEGTLTVGDPEAFARLLARGVGRHRAFGFGMLLLRPVR